MPKQFRPRRRRAPRKPTMAAAKKMVSKRKQVRAKKNMDTFFLRSKITALFVPQQGVSVANYLYSFVPLFDFTNTTSYGIINQAEFQLYRMQYDKFRINKVSWKVTPKANVMDQVVAQQDGTYNLSGQGVVHEVVDRDGPGPSSIAALSRYPSYKKHSIMSKWSRSYSVTYPVGTWLDCQNVYDPDMKATFKSLGLNGGLTMYAENFVEESAEAFNEPWAEVEISYDIVFTGKTSASLGFNFDSSGNVIGVTMTPQELITPASFTPVKNLRGTIHDTRTQDDTTEVTITDAQNQ